MKRRFLLKTVLCLFVVCPPLTVLASNDGMVEKTKLGMQVIITFNVQKEKLRSFLKIMEEVKRDLPLVDGCDGVNIYQNKDDIYNITLVEKWKSIKKHKVHIKQVIDSGDWKYISSHLSEDPKSQYSQEL